MSEEYWNNWNSEKNENTGSDHPSPEKNADTAAADAPIVPETAEPEILEAAPVMTESAPEAAEPENVEAAESTAYESATHESAAYETASQSDSETPSYENLYSDSSAQTAQPNYAAPYTNPYQNYQAPAYTERPASYGTQNPRQNPYGDGYYHQSFTRGTAGNHVNYTQPAVPNQYQQPAPTPKNRERKKNSGSLSKGGIALLLVVCLLISGAAGFAGSMIANNINKASYDSTAADTMVIHKVDTEAVVAGTEALVDKSTSEITNEVADTVVEITTEVMQTSSFYGQYIAQGAGSGVIISDDGYILTNNHVIEGASSIKVTTRGGESYDATLVGRDSELDIALLKIDATSLSAAVFGDSNELMVGSKAVIIGNPLGTLGGSVTEGIISALDRSIAIDGKTMHLMQTDAAINPGNSGGGMFNGQGELAGIVVAKSSSSSESIDNIGFVIPINNVLDILGDLKDYGYVRGRADTGMTFIDLSNQMYAWYYYGNNAAGVYISSVENGSNADNAGFRQGDRVISIDGNEIVSSDGIASYLAGKSAGDTVTFELERNGSKGTLELELEEAVPDSVQSKSNSSDSSNPFGGFGFNR